MRKADRGGQRVKDRKEGRKEGRKEKGRTDGYKGQQKVSKVEGTNWIKKG